MNIDGNFWIAVASLIFTVGVYFIGKAVGVGRKVNKLENLESGQSKLEINQTELAKSIRAMNESFTQCRTESQRCKGESGVKMDSFASGLHSVNETLFSHMNNRDLHTDGEWRKGTHDRMEAIATSIGNRIGSLENSLGSMISDLAKQVKNLGG